MPPCLQEELGSAPIELAEPWGEVVDVAGEQTPGVAGLAFLRVRGIERVRLHADLTMLGRLALALSRARAVPLAA